ncbi:MraY family glycosyltransferase [Mangrovibacterium diazotrophicum]|uniref:Uncharacterized protein n=1 Tax=Mangrovibacterium diazotrophicum TaxID=1261403 RepID=A0A419W5P7_9BACT|nr:hypothetical protein [Mangrovibacterium diazotrophicum]RKD90783.1 hypothetical protein BC643_1126 [Mangrovibacterium diazotrophicum]
MSEYIAASIAFLIPLIAVYIVQPSVAKVALAKNFIAEPEDKLPGIPLLSLGGVSMFIGINLSIALISNRTGFVSMHDLLAALIVLFFSGFLMDTNLAFRYFRFAVKMLAAILVVVRFHEGPQPLFSMLPTWMDVILQIGFIVVFMFAFHRLTKARKTLFLLLGLVNAIGLGLYFGTTANVQYWAILAFSLAGSLAGILSYSRYALYRQKPLPLIGHTGIYISALILATLWLNVLFLNPIF